MQLDVFKTAVTEAGWILPDWPAPRSVRACTTTRHGGCSLPPYDALNLAEHVSDDPFAVRSNRDRVRQTLRLPAEPAWLQQIHSTHVVNAATAGVLVEADASYAERPGIVCAVLTADCLPVLLCDETGSRVAAVHAGWRGLCGGVIEAAIQALSQPGNELLAWLGPAVGPSDYEVGEEVRDAFLAQSVAASAAFRPSPGGRWLADLYLLARQRLSARGVTRIFGGGFCTYRDQERFYSYRRDGVTGRMATLIWIER